MIYATLYLYYSPTSQRFTDGDNQKPGGGLQMETTRNQEHTD